MNNTNINENYYLGYYSHSKGIYDTANEKAEHDYLKSIFNGYIICPNKHLGSLKSANHYLEIVEKVNYLFVSELNGTIGKGSFEECTIALIRNVPIFVIKKKGTIIWIEEVTEVIKTSNHNLFEYGILTSRGISLKELPFTVQ